MAKDGSLGSVSGFGFTLVDIMIGTHDPVMLDNKNIINYQFLQLGGPAPTALVFLSRLGVNCEMNTLLGKDHFAEVIRELFKEEKVREGEILEVKGKKTPLATVVFDESNGERTIFYNKGLFSSVRPDQFNINFNKDTKLLIIDGQNPECSNAFIDKAHKQNIKVLLDVGSPKRDIESLITKSDIIFVPQIYWKRRSPNDTPENFAKKLLELGPEKVIVTLGHKGCYVAEKDNVFYQPIFEVKAVDSNGAGEIFMGAFAYGLLKSWDIRKTTEFSAAAGAISCTKMGKDEGIPRSEEQINNFIKKQT